MFHQPKINIMKYRSSVESLRLHETKNLALSCLQQGQDLVSASGPEYQLLIHDSQPMMILQHLDTTRGGLHGML